MAGEARLVQLQEQDAVADQVFHLTVHDRQQGSGDFVPIAIDVASLNAAREGVRPRNGDFGGGVADLAESLVFLDQPQTARGGQRRDTEVPASLIVSGRAPATSLRQGLNPREPIIKTEIEIDALHLTVRDQIGSCPELIVYGKTDRVPD